MRPCSLATVVTALMFAASTTACAPAPGATDAGDAGVDALGACGLPAIGVCAGNTLRRCEGREVVEVVCDALGGRPGGRCVTLEASGTSACAVEPGAPCRFVVEHGDHQHIGYASCAGEAAGCVLGANGASACVERTGGCEGPSIGACRGPLLVLDCRVGQPLAYDCAQLGGACDGARGACLGLPAGAACDRSTRVCEHALTCQFPRGRSTGVCSAE